MKRYLFLGLGSALFLLCAIFPDTVRGGVLSGLQLCGNVLIPSLLPMFVLAGMMQRLGLAAAAQKLFGGMMLRLFGISGAGAEALTLGLLGGYPLGAYTVASLRRRDLISKDEGERLLAFCNNSGPAFIIGAAGGALGSVRAGVLLYLVHIAAAVLTGIIFRNKTGTKNRCESGGNAAIDQEEPSFSSAVENAAKSCISLSAYVCVFSGFSALLEALISPPRAFAALFRGFLELGSGVGSLCGTSPAPLSMAIAGFILSWGGISVHLQTLGAVADTDISCARHLAGRALCGVIAAVLSYGAGFLC